MRLIVFASILLAFVGAARAQEEDQSPERMLQLEGNLHRQYCSYRRIRNLRDPITGKGVDRYQDGWEHCPIVMALTRDGIAAAIALPEPPPIPEGAIVTPELQDGRAFVKLFRDYYK